MTMKMKKDAKSKSDKKKKKPNMVDLTGHWFVHFGGEYDTAKIEGSRILTITGEFDADHLLDSLTQHLQDSLPESVQELIKKNNDRIVIRSLNRIDQPIAIGKAK